MRVSPRQRDTLALAATSAAIWGFLLVLAAAVRHGTGPLALDVRGGKAVDSERVASHLGRLGRNHFMQRLTWLGSPFGVIVLSLCLVALALWWRDRIGAALALAGPLVSELLTELVLKPLVDRTNPLGDYLFPSGHATGVTAVVFVLVVLLYRRYGRRAMGVLPLALIPIGAVGVAVVRLRWHYLTDVVGGVCVGAATVLALAAAVQSRSS